MSRKARLLDLPAVRGITEEEIARLFENATPEAQKEATEVLRRAAVSRAAESQGGAS